MFCPRCGEKIEFKDSNFCFKCGMNLTEFLKIEVASDNNEGNDSNLKKDDEIKELIPVLAEKNNEQKTINDDSIDSAESNKEDLIKTLPPTLRESSLYKESWFDRMKDKWGAGWLFFGWLFFSPQATKYYKSDNEYSNAIPLLGFLLCMILYYFFRQKLSHKIERSWLRSTLSVLITYVIFFLVSISVGIFLNIFSNKTTVKNSDWKIRNLSSVGIIVDSPFDLVKSSLSIPEDAKDLNQNVQQYNYQTNSFVVTINFVQYKAGTTIILDNYAPRMAWFLNKSNNFSDFRYSETKITKDSSEGRIVNGSMKSEGNVINLLAVVLSHDTKLWYVICFFDTTSANKLIAQRIINSVSFINDYNVQNKLNDKEINKLRTKNNQPNSNGIINNKLNQKNINDYPSIDKILFLKAEIDNPQPRVNEEFRITFILYTKVNISSPTILVMPTFSNLITKQIPIENINFEIGQFEGERIRKAVVLSYVLKAQKKGLYIITPFGLKVPVVIDKQTKTYSKYEIKSNVCEIKVI